MKLPHKLDKELSDEKELRVWLNQLRDYLSDKEEDNLACCGGRVTEKDLEEYLSKDKEASKGELGIVECECGRFFSKSGYKKHLKEGHDLPAPPQQEESRGECGHVNQYTACDDCGAEIEPQLKEESPKEDEIRRTLIEWMYKEGVYLSGRRKSEYYVEDLLNILRRTVVSKVKIKEILNEAELKGDSGYCGKCSHIVRKLEGLEEL